LSDTGKFRAELYKRGKRSLGFGSEKNVLAGEPASATRKIFGDVKRKDRVHQSG